MTGPSTEILFDASKLYDAYRRKTSEPLEAKGCLVERIRFESSSYPILLEEDGVWEENIRFEFPLFRISGTLDETYTASVERRLVMEVGNCDTIGEANKGLFERFIGKVSDFLWIR